MRMKVVFCLLVVKHSGKSVLKTKRRFVLVIVCFEIIFMPSGQWEMHGQLVFSDTQFVVRAISFRSSELTTE